MLNKYTYKIRQSIYNRLRLVPDWLAKPIIGLYVELKNRQLKKSLTPLMLILYVTNRCNARCAHCFYWQSLNSGTADELTIDQIKKIVSSLKAPLNTLILTGGEPFLRNDMAEICRIFVTKNKTKKINIASNGYFTDKISAAIVEILEKNSGLDLNVQISLDGLKDKHDSIRGIEIFDRALETISRLADLQKKYSNFHVTVLSTVSKYNLNDINELRVFLANKFPTVNYGYQFVRSAKFDTYNINHEILENFDPQESAEAILSVGEMKEVISRNAVGQDEANGLLNKFSETMNQAIVEIKESKKCFVKCLAGRYDGVIYADGNVAMCEFTKPFANLRDFNYDFKQLWHCEAANNRRKQIVACYCTHNCNIMNAMRYDAGALLKVIK